MISSQYILVQHYIVKRRFKTYSLHHNDAGNYQVFVGNRSSPYDGKARSSDE